MARGRRQRPRQTQVGTRRPPIFSVGIAIIIMLVMLSIIGSFIQHFDILGFGFIPALAAVMFISFMADTFFEVV